MKMMMMMMMMMMILRTIRSAYAMCGKNGEYLNVKAGDQPHCALNI
jgi:hypothetical protein